MCYIRHTHKPPYRIHKLIYFNHALGHPESLPDGRTLLKSRFEFC